MYSRHTIIKGTVVNNRTLLIDNRLQYQINNKIYPYKVVLDFNLQCIIAVVHIYKKYWILLIKIGKQN